MSRYSNIEYIKKLRVRYALRLVAKAMKEENRNQLFQLYLCDRPHMKQKISFDDYLLKAGFRDYTEMKYDNRDRSVIEQELLEVYAKFKKEGS